MTQHEGDAEKHAGIKKGVTREPGKPAVSVFVSTHRVHHRAPLRPLI
jgi:hypothetical protein